MAASTCIDAVGGGSGSDDRTAPSGAVFAAPVKRSITIAGHQTAVSLEPIFWAALQAEAMQHGVPLNALVARIDLARMQSDAPPNLASAIRCWLFAAQQHE